MQLYFPVSIVWDWNRGPPDPQPETLGSAPSRIVLCMYGEIKKIKKSLGKNSVLNIIG